MPRRRELSKLLGFGRQGDVKSGGFLKLEQLSETGMGNMMEYAYGILPGDELGVVKQ